MPPKVTVEEEETQFEDDLMAQYKSKAPPAPAPATPTPIAPTLE